MIFVPPGHIGSFVATIYDDDGESNAYATGGYCVLKVTVTARTSRRVPRGDGPQGRGAWTPPYTELALVLPPGDTRSFVGGGLRADHSRRERF